MDRQTQLEALLRQYMASQPNRGAVSDAEMRPMAPQQGMGQMTEADMAIGQNQQFNQDAQRQQADMFYQNQMQQYGAERPDAVRHPYPEQPTSNVRQPYPMTDADRQILMNQLFNQNAQQSQADAFRNARPEMGLLQMYGAGR